MGERDRARPSANVFYVTRNPIIERRIVTRQFLIEMEGAVSILGKTLADHHAIDVWVAVRPKIIAWGIKCRIHGARGIDGDRPGRTVSGTNPIEPVMSRPAYQRRGRVWHG